MGKISRTLAVQYNQPLTNSFFNPIISVIYGITHFKIEKLDQEPEDKNQSGSNNEEAVLNQG